jgi:hypothetical protein
MFPQSPHLTVFALSQRHLEPSFVAFAAQDADLCRAREVALDIDGFGPARERRIVDNLLHFGGVHLGHVAAGVTERLSKVTIIGKEQDAAGVEVQATDGDHPYPHLLEDVLCCRPSFRVGERGEHAPGFVHHAVAQRLALQSLSVELDLGRTRVGFGAQLGHNLPVHAHASSGN